MRITDRPTVQCEIEISAPRSIVWALITDPTKVGMFSPECSGGSWDDASGGLGSRFTCRNGWGGREWTTTSTVTQWEPDRVFAWVVGDADIPSAIWRYQLHPTKAGGTRLVESMEFGMGASGTTARIAEVPDKEEQVIAARTAEHQRNIETTLAAIQRAAEDTASQPPNTSQKSST